VRRNALGKCLFRLTRTGRMLSNNSGGVVVIYKDYKLYIPREHPEIAESILFHKFKDLDTIEVINYFESNYPENKKKLFLDLGANFGYWSLILAKHGFDAYAVEGSEEISKVGKINFILNNLHSENYIESWVVPRKDKKYFKHESDFSFTNHLSENGIERIRNVTTLDELLKKHEPSVIKMDLEGFDAEILLNTDLHFITKLSYLVIEVENGSNQSSLIENHLLGQGFTLRKKIGVDGKEIKDSKKILANFHFINNI
jgi:FkbM family methyltransferase